MKDYMAETIGILEVFFLIPTFIMVFAVSLFNKFVLGKKVDNTDKEYKKAHYLFSLVVWLVVCGWIFYDNQFKKITYVYACNTNNINKCYNVPADYYPGSCDEGHCDSSTFSKIYFTGGGHISFDYCDKINDKWTCYGEDEKDGNWELKIDRVEKVKK